MTDVKVFVAINEVLEILKKNKIDISKEIRHECFLIADKEIDVDGFMNGIRKEHAEAMKGIKSSGQKY